MQRPTLFLLCFFLGLCPKMQAANDLLPGGAAQAGMAGAGLCMPDLWSAHYNQAALAWLERPSAGIYYALPFSLRELSTQAFAAVVPGKFGAVSVNYRRFGYSQYSDSRYGLSYSRKFGPNVSAGLQLNYMETRIGDGYGRVGVPGFEASVLAQIIPGLRIGFHLYNPTRPRIAAYNNERIPAIGRLGLGYAVNNKVQLLADVEKDISTSGPSLRVGIDYRPVKMLFLRAGVSNNPSVFSAGFGLFWKNLRLDLSAGFHQQLGYSPHTGLLYTF